MAKTTKLLSSRHTMSFLMILLIVFSTLAPLIPLASAQLPTISLDPTLVEGLLPGDTFSLNIMITKAENVYAWQFELSFAPYLEVLDATGVTEGGFLQQGGSTTFSASIKNTQGLVQVGCSLTEDVSGVSGDGFLATVSFKVLGGGQSILDLHDTGLVDPDLFKIEHTVGPDGLFIGKAPYASFNYSPRPDVEGYPPTFNETITFDASQSYDPDGGTIVEYFWDFADGTTDTTTTPTTTHVYIRPPSGAESGEFDVNLTITDNHGYNDWASKTVRVYIRDIAITQMIVDPAGQVKAGTLVTMNITVENLGSSDENLTVTTFYDDVTIQSQYIPKIPAKPPVPPYINIKNLTFTWDTTGISTGEYTLKAVAYTNPNDRNMTNNELVWGNITISETSILSYNIKVYGVTFKVGVETNSHLSGFKFDYKNKQFLFNLAGLSEFSGYCNVTIPQRMLNATIPPELLNTTITEPIEGGWNIIRNGSFTPYTPTRNETHYFIHFNFTFASTYEIKIIGTQVPIPPQPILTMSTTRAFVDEIVTLDGSQSYDPDGGTIVSYFWSVTKYDPGKGTYTSVWNHTTTTPTDTFSHNESAFGINALRVTLTVTNSLGFGNSTQPQELEVFDPYDLAITAITAAPTILNIRQLATINVTIQSTLNLGGKVLTVRVRVFGNDTELTRGSVTLSPPQTRMVTLEWNTTDFALGIYTVWANVTAIDYGGVTSFPPESDTSDNEKTFDNMRVKKWDSTVSLLATPTSLTIGSSVSFLGSVSLAKTGINVTLQSKLGDEAWKNVTTVKTDKKGEYFYTWTPAQAGVYQLKAMSHGNATISANVTSIITVTVNRLASSISISLDSKSVTAGAKVTISGAITPVRAGVAVKINYRKAGETSWTLLETVTTDSEGKYSYEWETTEAGDYELQTSWEGDVNTMSGQSDVEAVTIHGDGFQSYYIYIAAGAILAVVVVVAIYFLRKRKP